MSFPNSLYPYHLLDRMLRPANTVFMYHSIADNPRDPHAIHPDRFAAQMEGISRSAIPVVSLERAIHENCRGALVLTFDDAYRDFLSNAAPVLRQRRLPATVFAPTGLLGGRAVWDTYDTSKPLMDWDELGEVSRLGFSVGSHTVTHARLTEMTDGELQRELTNSLEALQVRIPSAIRAVSYPGGFCGEREMAAARAAGYLSGVLVAARAGNYSGTSPWALRRRKWQ